MIDSLIQSNPVFLIIQPSVFLENYVAWWASRTNSRPLSIAFTTFLFEACACAAQAPSAELQQRLEYELTERISQTAERLHEVVIRMSDLITAGTGGIYRSLQCMLTTSWFKGEGRMIDAWHALATAIHEEQELGMWQAQIGT
jgi:hypothetical protein